MATKLSEELTKDDEWITEHFEELVDKYEGKWIAIVNGKIVATGKSAVEVEEVAMKDNPEKLPSVILIPQKEDFECLLLL